MNRRRYGVLLLAAAAAAGCKLERYSPQATERTPLRPHLISVRSVVYPVSELEAARAWYASLLGSRPYIDGPSYVGFDVNGYELGLDPDTTKPASDASGTIVYWTVPSADSVVARAVALGATVYEPVRDVRSGVRMGAVLDPFGNILGVVDMPAPAAAVR